MIGTAPFPPPLVSPIPGLPNAAPGGAPSPQPPPEDTPREHSLPRYINYLADYSGCGHWRILWPEAVINARGDGKKLSLIITSLNLRLIPKRLDKIVLTLLIW